MAVTEPNDLAIHEAGHALIYYLMSDLVEIFCITIDLEYSKSIDKHSDGGVVYKYLKHPTLLNFLELDQFCLSCIGGLAADLVNEHDGKIDNEYFYSDAFPLKIGHFHYQGDMIAFHNKFMKLNRLLKVTPQYYNFISIQLVTNLFSDKEVLKVLISVRNLILEYKILTGQVLKNYLEATYLSEWKKNHWEKIKEDRKRLFK